MKSYLKIFIGLCLLSAMVGCVSAREAQNPQPRLDVPCGAWVEAAGTKVEAVNEKKAETKPADKKKSSSSTKKTSTQSSFPVKTGPVGLKL